MSSSEMCQDPARRFFSAPTLLVIGVWIVMLVGALGFLSHCAGKVPFAEDTMLVPYVAGDEPLTMDFLFSQYSNHIIPLPKLVLILLARVTHDFRASMYLSVLLCAGIALALAFAAKSLRGRFDYFDAFFALCLLHLGHWETFLLGFAIQEVMSTGFLAIILLVILRARTSLTVLQSLVVGLSLVILPSTGMAGFLVVPPLAVWLTYCVWLNWRSDGPGSSALAAFQMVFVLVALACLIPYYVIMPHGMLWHHGPASAAEKGRAILAVLMQLLTLSFGSSAATAWLPFLNQERSCRLVGSVVLALSVLGLVLLFVRRQAPEERLRKTGLALYLLANLLLLAGIAYGRSGLSRTIGLSPRYSLYSVPILWGLYFTWQLYGTRLGGRLIPAGLFVFMCAMFSLNMQLGYSSGQGRYAELRAVEHDLATAEVPACDIANTYHRYLSGTRCECYKIRGKDDLKLFRNDLTKMVNMLQLKP